MGLPCKRNMGKICNGCGACEPAPEYDLTCDNCKAEIENLAVCLMIGDYAFCQDCVENGWTQWHKTNESAGRRLARMRKQKDMSMRDLASKIGVSKSLLGRYERGEIYIPQTRFAAIRAEVGENF